MKQSLTYSLFLLLISCSFVSLKAQETKLKTFSPSSETPGIYQTGEGTFNELGELIDPSSSDFYVCKNELYSKEAPFIAPPKIRQETIILNNYGYIDESIYRRLLYQLKRKITHHNEKILKQFEYNDSGDLLNVPEIDPDFKIIPPISPLFNFHKSSDITHPKCFFVSHEIIDLFPYSLISGKTHKDLVVQLKENIDFHNQNYFKSK